MKSKLPLSFRLLISPSNSCCIRCVWVVLVLVFGSSAMLMMNVFVKAFYRAHREMKQRRATIRAEFDHTLNELGSTNLMQLQLQKLVVLLRSLLFFYHPLHDQKRLQAVCRLLLLSSRNPNPDANFFGMILNPNTRSLWLAQAKAIVSILLSCLKNR